MERRQVQFHGRVQGVGFRATTRAVASGFAVTGWVRNEADGSVLAEVQGDRAQVELFLAALRARMEGYIAGEAGASLAPVEGEAGFQIRR